MSLGSADACEAIKGTTVHMSLQGTVLAAILENNVFGILTKMRIAPLDRRMFDVESMMLCNLSRWVTELSITVMLI